MRVSSRPRSAAAARGSRSHTSSVARVSATSTSKVDQRVLVRGPETEMLVEVALEIGPASAPEIGTGSGAIALAIADEIPEAEITATDVSAGALVIAPRNAARLGSLGHIRLRPKRRSPTPAGST